jgi:hypothetical protein
MARRWARSGSVEHHARGFFLNDLDLGVVAIDGTVVARSLILEAAIFERWTEGVQ